MWTKNDLINNNRLRSLTQSVGNVDSKQYTMTTQSCLADWRSMSPSTLQLTFHSIKTELTWQFGKGAWKWWWMWSEKQENKKRGTKFIATASSTCEMSFPFADPQPWKTHYKISFNCFKDIFKAWLWTENSFFPQNIIQQTFDLFSSSFFYSLAHWQLSCNSSVLFA